MQKSAATRLLAALDPLDFPARMRLLAQDPRPLADGERHRAAYGELIAAVCGSQDPKVSGTRELLSSLAFSALVLLMLTGLCPVSVGHLPVRYPPTRPSSSPTPWRRQAAESPLVLRR